MRKENILVLGDSHARVFGVSHARIFKKRFLKTLLFQKKFFVFSVLGATISGIENPNSKTQSRNIFRSAIEKYKGKVNKCIVLLGEVDTGFVLWHKHENDGTDINELLNLTVEKYARFLKEIDDAGMQVIVISAPLPTIKDDCAWGEVADLRKNIKADQLTRTKLTVQFNSIVNQICSEYSFVYLSMDDISLNKKTGLVKKIFRNISKKDHHYNRFIYSLALYFKLKRIL